MPRPDPRAPQFGQIGMFEAKAVEEPGCVIRGRHSDAMDRAIEANRAAGAVDDIDEGVETVLRAAAWSLDMFEKQNQPYGPSHIIDPLMNALKACRMTPESRAEAADDSVKALLEELAKE